MKSTFLVLTILSALLFSLPVLSANEQAPPNIVLIVSDDQGYKDLGCFGSDEVLTPNLDRLAAGGTKLTNFYVSWPACTPSRGSILTGRYPQRNGIYDMIRNEAPDYGKKYTAAEYSVTFERIGGMDLKEKLLPEFLKPSGYKSGIFGKWDLGVHKRFLPIARGFDTFYGFSNTGVDYYTHERYGVPSMFRDNTATEEDKGTYCTDLFRREAISFLNKNSSKPFFLYLPFNAPHNASSLDPKIRSGAQAPDEYKAMYPELLKKAAYKKTESYGRYKTPAIINNREKKRLEYVASITSMDAAIGKVLDYLDKNNLAENTIVVFFSDNGGSGGTADNSPLKGSKAWVFEGGIRVPCIVRYPKRIKPGTTSHELLTTLELLPTFLNAANIEKPKDIIFDGFDMMPVLADGKPSPRTEMFWERRDDKAARVGNWKWVDSAKGKGLFNLKDDIGERKDLSKSHPEKLKELKQAFSGWKKKMAAADPRGPFKDF